jgi:hypothetical protein
MRRFASLSIVFTLTLLLVTPNLAAALFTQEAEEIPYQINNSDRIVIGTVSKIDICDYYTNNSITVKEWLYNPLPEKTIIVRTNIGTNAWTEDEAEFTQNESVLLMLMDQRPDKGIFRMFIGFPGKHPISDRDAVVQELKVQGKWNEENQTGNKTNETGIARSTGSISSAGDQEDSSKEKQNSVPGFNIICGLSALYLAYKIRR